MSANNLWLRWAALYLFGLISTPYAEATQQSTADKIHDAILRGETVAILRIEIPSAVNIQAMGEDQRFLYRQFNSDRRVILSNFRSAVDDLGLTVQQKKRLIILPVRYNIEKTPVGRTITFKLQVSKNDYYNNFIETEIMTGEDVEGIVYLKSYDQYKEYMNTTLPEYVDKRNVKSIHVIGDVDDLLLPNMISEGLESGAIQAKVSVDPDLVMPYHTERIAKHPVPEYIAPARARRKLANTLEGIAEEHPQLTVEPQRHDVDTTCTN